MPPWLAQLARSRNEIGPALRISSSNAVHRGAVPAPLRSCWMIPLLLTAAILQAPDRDAAIKLCRPVLERKAGGEIADVEIIRSRARRGSRTIEGQATVFLGMGPPAPESASAHHLIRTMFRFECRVHDSRVVSARINTASP